MDTPLWERLQISLDSGLLTEIFQRFTLVQPGSVNVYEGHLETSNSIKSVRIAWLMWIPTTFSNALHDCTRDPTFAYTDRDRG